MTKAEKKIIKSKEKQNIEKKKRNVKIVRHKYLYFSGTK